MPGYHAGPGDCPKVRGSCPQAALAASGSSEKSPKPGCPQGRDLNLSPWGLCCRPLREWVTAWCPSRGRFPRQGSPWIIPSGCWKLGCP